MDSTLRSTPVSTLTTSYLRHIEARLMALQEELDARLHPPVLAPGEARQATDVWDFKDAAAEEWDATLDEAELAQAARERDEIVAALRRIREGTYGDCLECGRPIPVHRIEAVPTAALCAACQSSRERHEAR